MTFISLSTRNDWLGLVALCLLASVVSGLLSTAVSPWLMVIVATAFVGLVLLTLAGRKATIVAIVVSVAVDRYNVPVLGLHVTAERTLLPLLVGSLLISAKTASGRGRRPPAMVGVLVGLLVYMGTLMFSSFVNSPSVADSVKNTIQLMLAVASFLLLPWALRDWQEVSLMAMTYVVVASFESVFGILVLGVYSASGINLGVQASALGASPYGSMWEGNIFGSFVTSALVLCAAVITRSDLRPRHRRILISCGVILLIGSVVSLSRGAWLGGAAGMIMLSILLPRAAGRRLAVSAFAAVPVLAAAVLLAGPAVSARADLLAGLLQGQPDSTTVERYQTNAIAIDEWTQHPLEGWGTGIFGLEHISSSQTGAWISNLEIHALHDSGIIGLAGLCVALGGTVVQAVVRCRAVKAERPTSSSVLAGLAAACVCLLVAFQSTEATSLAFTWLIFGVALAAVRQSYVEPSGAPTFAGN